MHELPPPTQPILADPLAIETQATNAQTIDPTSHGRATGCEADPIIAPGNATAAFSPQHFSQGVTDIKPVIVEHAHAPVSLTASNLQASFHATELQVGPSAPALTTVVPDQSAHASVDAATAPNDTSGTSETSAAALTSPAHLDSPNSLDGPTTSTAIGPGGATAAQVRQALGESGLNVNGAGIKVGVLSDSFNDLGGAAADEADGALPSASKIQVLSDLSSGGTDEGRAMMQIVHDIAPGASLAFYTADNSEQDFANGILALAAAGCKVICDDVGYFDEPFFQNGIVAQAIQTVEAEGVTYVTSAGNNASNAYQSAWTQASGTFDGFSFGDAENFGGSIVQTVTVNTEGLVSAVPLVLQWNQAYGAATSDLHLWVFRNGSLYGDFNNQNYSWELHNPLVFAPLPTGTYQIVVVNESGSNPGVIKEVLYGDGLPVSISGANAGTVVGHAETSGVITAGAVNTAATPAFGVSPAVSESFSSSGAGTEIFFANNGTPLSSPEVLSPVAVSGVDNIATTVPGGLSDFYGTSAASASLAGVAAMILAANPGLTPAEVEQIMEQTAAPMSNSAVSGAGLAQVNAAVAAAEAFGNSVVIQTDGNTSLVRVGSIYLLDNTNTGSSVELKDGGAPVTVGEFGSISPVGAVQTSSGYEIAWQIPGANQFTFWTTDSNGNYTSNLSSLVVGTSFMVESQETVFGQDLNGDGTIGVTASVIQSAGATSLLAIANNYYIYTNWTGPELKYGGAPVTAGEFGAIAPIGAIHTSSGYEIVWKIPGINQFTFWAVDNNGNYVGNLTGLVPGNDFLVEQAETQFGRDLNGDGTIGVTSSLVQTDGSTSLLHIADNYYLYTNGIGPELKYASAPVTDGEFGNIAPVGAIQTSSGYDIAWKVVGTNEFTFWATDGNGNFATNLTGLLPGTSSTVEQFETIFHQDFNGDSVIGVPSGPSVASSAAFTLVAASSAHVTDDGTTPTVTPSALSALVIGFTGDGIAESDQIDLRGLDSNKVRSTFDSSSGALSVTDGSTTASLHFLSQYSQDNFRFSNDGNGGTLIAVTAPLGQTGTASQVVNLAAHDTLIFAPNFGQVSLSNFAPATDTLQFSKTVFSDVAALLAATHDDASGNAVITDVNHDTITLQHVTTAQLLAHQSDFHFT